MERLTGIRSVNIARLVYLLICELAGAAMANHIAGSEKIWIGVVGGLVLAVFFILVESSKIAPKLMLTPKLRLVRNQGNCKVSVFAQRQSFLFAFIFLILKCQIKQI